MLGVSKIQNSFVKPIDTGCKPIAFEHIPNTAQFKGSDYATAIDVRRGISLQEALNIAAANDEIDHFFYVKGYTMVLELPEGMPKPEDPLNLIENVPFIFDSGKRGHGYCRIFHHGDAVFFKKGGEAFGSAPGLADIYRKQ